jgi:L-ornithine Nalpha-acyltransferase
MSSLFPTPQPAGPAVKADCFGPPLRVGGWEARLARSAEEVSAVLALRTRAFRGGDGAPRGRDGDRFDAEALHLWVGTAGSGAPLATLRVLVHADGASLLRGYAAQFYGLEGLAAQPGTVLELGRLCLHPDHHAPDLARLLWAGVTRLAGQTGAVRLIGCASFRGNDARAIAPHMAALAQRHLGPTRLRPRAIAPETQAFSGFPPVPAADLALPPLLRGYLVQGGWVGDHLVVDRDLGTCHVFTCLDIAAMPEGRKRILRALAGAD